MKSRKMLVRSAAALLFGLAVTAVTASDTVLSQFTQAVIYAIFAVGIGVLLRQNGLISFGHALYFGGAGYGIGLLLQANYMPAEWAILAVLLGVAVFAFLIGLVIVRVPGIAFGMLTLAIGQMFFLSISRSRGSLGGADGLSIEWPATLFGVPQSMLLKPGHLFFLCWTTLVVVVLLLGLLLDSRFGAVTEAVRDNEERARFIGIKTVLPRATVYALSALVTGVAGILAALNSGFVSPDSLNWSLSGMALMMVVVGGSTVVWGPALGAIVYFLFKDILGGYESHWMMIFGVALIAVIVLSPKGIAGGLQRMFHRKSVGTSPTSSRAC